MAIWPVNQGVYEHPRLRSFSLQWAWRGLRRGQRFAKEEAAKEFAVAVAAAIYAAAEGSGGWKAMLAGVTVGVLLYVVILLFCVLREPFRTIVVQKKRASRLRRPPARSVSSIRLIRSRLRDWFAVLANPILIDARQLASLELTWILERSWKDVNDALGEAYGLRAFILLNKACRGHSIASEGPLTRPIPIDREALADYAAHISTVAQGIRADDIHAEWSGRLGPGPEEVKDSLEESGPHYYSASEEISS